MLYTLNSFIEKMPLAVSIHPLLVKDKLQHMNGAMGIYFSIPNNYYGRTLFFNLLSELLFCNNRKIS